MRRFWMLLLAVMALAALLAVPALAAETTGALGELPASVDAVGSQLVSADTAVGTCLYAKPAGMEAADWLAYEVLVRGTSPKLTAAGGAAFVLTFEADGIYTRSSGEVWHCACGYLDNKHAAGCVETCGGYDVKWTAWSGTTIEASGYYYLSEKKTISTQSKIGKAGTTAADSAKQPDKNIVIDLNGYNLTSEKRAFQTRGDANFTLCNSKSTGGVVIGKGDGSGQNYGVIQTIGYNNTLAIMRGVTLRYVPKTQDNKTKTQAVTGTAGTIIMYGGTIDGSQTGEGSILTQAAVNVNSGTTSYTSGEETVKVTYKGRLIMYKDATIIGVTTAAGGTGGALYITGGEVECYGGTITGGAAGNGGAIYMMSGSFTADKATINGGTASTCGGAIYMTGGTFTARNGSLINGGTAPNGGAVAVMGGKFILDASTVQNGIADRTPDTFHYDESTKKTVSDNNGSGGKGANFYVSGGELLIQNNSTVKGGYADEFDTYSDTTLYGGSAIFAEGSAVVTVNASTLEGYREALKYKRGGTITNYGATITIENDSTVTATWINIDSPVVWNNGGTFTLRNSTLDASGMSQTTKTYVTYAGAVRNISYTDADKKTHTGTFNMESGTIIGYKATSTNGGGSVYNSAIFRMSGGIIRGGSTTSDGIGGNVVVTGGTFEMTGGTITGGNANEGGNVYMTGGTFNLYNGTISEGSATAYGGNVWISGGTFNAIPNPEGASETDKRIIKEGEVTSTTASVYGGNFYVSGGSKACAVNLKGATVSDGQCSVDYTPTAEEKEEGKGKKYAYGGNIYLESSSKSYRAVLTIEGSTISDGTVSALWDKETTWAPGGNIYLNSYCDLVVKDSTVSGGQALATVDNTSVDGKNLYVNYNATATLNSGAKIINDATASTQESILIQGGTLNIHNGAEITTTKGVTGRNIQVNNQAVIGGSYSFANLSASPVINMDGGTISGGNIVGSGGNIFVETRAKVTLNITGGEIKNGATTNSGANLHVGAMSNTEMLTAYKNKYSVTEEAALAALASHVTIGGTAKISGGAVSEKFNGGNVYMGENTYLTLEGTAEIFGGSCKDGGGNLYSNGHVVIQDSAKIYGGSSSSGTSATHSNVFFVNADVELLGGVISGGVNIIGQNVGTLKIGGAPVVDPALCTLAQKPANGVAISYNAAESGSLPTSSLKSFTVANLTKDANVVLSVSRQADNVVVATSVDEASVLHGLHYINSDYYIQKNDQSQLVLVAKANATGATFNGGSILYSLNDAIAKVSGNTDWITLMSNYEDDVTVKNDLYLDLNGKTITGNISMEGGKLYLLDTANASYTDEGGKVNGKITGTVERAFTTGTLEGYGHNYRYLVLKTDEGYSAHRIYLTVKSTVLYPNKPALNYRTVFKCDETVAQYVNAYGVKIGAEAYDPVYSNYLANGIELGKVVDNSYISQLNNILDRTWNLDKQTLYTETELVACAYITLTDSFGVGKEITSSGVEKSFQNMMEAADGQTLTAVQQATLKDLYNNYAELMGSWNLTKIPGFKDSKTAGFQYRCMCNDPTSTGNPCAANGHKHFVWQPWTGDVTVSGNYYLTEAVTLDSVTVPANVIVSIDLCGKTLTATSITVAEDAVLNLTNSAETKATVSAAMTVNGNVSIYSGVAVNGTVTGGGYMNLYGGTATKTDDFTGEWYSGTEE